MLRVPVISLIAVTRLAALIVAGFCVYVLLTPEAVLGRTATSGASGFGEIMRSAAGLSIVGGVGLAAIYAVLRHGPHNGMRYLAFVVLLTPAFLFLPTLTRTPQWPVSLIIMGLLFFSAISCLLPNPVQAWTTFEPQRR